MDKMIDERDAARCFAALKLIEQLYKDGEIPAHVFRSIANDYAEVVDLSRFDLGADPSEEEVTA